MAELKDNPGVRIPPPAVFFTMGLIGGAAEFIVPITMGLPGWSKYVGIAVMILSFLCLVVMSIYFRRYGTSIEPWKPTSTLITSGPYRFSRNPVYIFACGIPIGLGFIFNSYWALFAFIPALFIVYHTAVKKEEKYLEAKFGQVYLDYKRKVRRWI